MRLTTWNCCSGPAARKLAELSVLDADIAVVPECPRITERRGITVWVGANLRKGMAVLARAPWQIHRIRAPRGLPRYILPLQVSGPEAFLLLAVWAQKQPVTPYVRGVHRAVHLCRSLMSAQSTVLIGDFNSNTIWDAEHPAALSHSALVQQLAGMGLVSAYHDRHGEAQGSETRPTFYLYRHERRPFHIDYCFLPAGWMERVRSVTVGQHAEWASKSDHMPLTVELASPGPG